MIRRLSEIVWSKARKVKRRKDGRDFLAVQMDEEFMIHLPNVTRTKAAVEKSGRLGRIRTRKKKIQELVSVGGSVRGKKGDFVLMARDEDPPLVIAVPRLDPKSPNEMKPFFNEAFEFVK